MPRGSSRARSNSPEEHPQLKVLGLKTMPIRGDGNCMFSAFSDQFYGDVTYAKVIRAKVVAHMRNHPDRFKPFISAGGWRAAPKRKNRGSPNYKVEMPNEDQHEMAFQAHLDRMAKNGTYGDNLEITAFANEFEVDVKIYELDGHYSYFIKSSEPNDNPIVHIARHSFEHYSSIRNIDGPSTGLPKIAREAEEQPQEDCSTSLPSLSNSPSCSPASSSSRTPATSACGSPVKSDSSGKVTNKRGRDEDENIDIEFPRKRQDRKQKPQGLPAMSAIPTLII